MIIAHSYIFIHFHFHFTYFQLHNNDKNQYFESTIYQ
jgi:hypothetical protein